MNVKQLVNMIYKEDLQIKITVGYGEDFNTTLDINNPFHLEAYGKFKVDTFRALNSDSYEINIATTPCKPIVEE